MRAQATGASSAATTPSPAFTGKQAGRLPTLLAGGIGGRFVVRPARIMTGAWVTVYHFIGQFPKKGGRIQWLGWTSLQAHGVGKLWMNDCIPSTAEGTWHGYRAQSMTLA